MENKFLKPELNESIPDSLYYNTFQFEHCETLLLKKGVRKQSQGKYIFNSTTINYSGGLWWSDEQSEILPQNAKYTSFDLLSHFLGTNKAIDIIRYELRGFKTPYIRVGVDFYKLIHKVDRFGLDCIDVKRWNRQEIISDHGKHIVDIIRKFDNFILEPDNINFQQTINGSFNIYRPVLHKPVKGEIKWSEILMNHIFGEQVEIGYRYMKILYEHPKQILPILVLASTERQTGKTTFVNWLNQIFGDNMVIINEENISSTFNSSYATANIIAIEETVSEKTTTVEKLKSLSTQKFVNVNQKHIDNYKLPFFGKFIVTTNDEKKFLKVDENEIRFWVRKIPPPKVNQTDIEELILDEIPAFLEHLKSLPGIDFSRSRMVFTADELKTEQLTEVIEESKPALYKDILMEIEYYFDENQSIDEFYATAKQIKLKWFLNNNMVSLNYIKRVIEEFFKIMPSEPCERFNLMGESKVGRYYHFTRNKSNDAVIRSKNEEILPF